MMAYMLAQGRTQRPRLNRDADDLPISPITLATSSQPCCQCYGATVWAGIDRLLSGARAEDVMALTEFDEGPLPADWIGELNARGIEGPPTATPHARCCVSLRKQGGQRVDAVTLERALPAISSSPRKACGRARFSHDRSALLPPGLSEPRRVGERAALAGHPGYARATGAGTWCSSATTAPLSRPAVANDLRDKLQFANFATDPKPHHPCWPRWPHPPRAKAHPRLVGRHP
jgi:hypothetical protein